MSDTHTHSAEADPTQPTPDKVVPGFVHLHNHSHYSLLDGLAKPDQLINRAKELGMKSIALTDHGVMYGIVEFYQKAKKAGMHPILGVEAYLAPRKLTDKVPKVDSSYFHQLLLAETYEGYKNLLKLVSTAHLEGMYYKPRIDLETLASHAKGIIASSSCLGGMIPQALIAGDHAKAERLLLQFIEIFGKDNFFIELQHHPKMEDQNKTNPQLIELAEKFNVPLIATGDIHYVYKEEQEAHEVLLAVNTGASLDQQDRMTLADIDLYMESPEFFAETFAHVPEILENSVKIAERCQVEIPLGTSLLPAFPCPEGMTDVEYLQQLCDEGFADRYKNDTEEFKAQARKQLTFELEVINRMGFPSYFLIVQDFVNWAKDQGIFVGPGRGSAAGSLVAYVLKITNLDPIKYGFLFERFLNPDRISMPDIDMDFADDRRGEVINYVRQKYGDSHVAGIITFGTMMSRAAVRDVGRALAMTYGEVDAIAKLIPAPVQGRHIPLRTAIDMVPDLKQRYDTDPQIKRLIDLSCQLEGTVRHASQHACAIVITPQPLTEFCPVQSAQKGDVGQVTQYSMKPIEEIGLLKMDFLGLSNLTVMRNATRIIKKVYGIEVDVNDLPLEDTATYELLARGDTTGVFQLESDGMKRYIKELKPSVFSDITAMAALYRPGPMQFIPTYIARKHGLEPVVYDHPKLELSFKETYGIPVFQEQVMQASKDLAGFTGGEADTLRKAMGKKIAKLMAEMRVKFVDGCQKHSKMDRQTAADIFQKFEDFAAYGFNKSHAACYAMIAFQTAYLKAHYPAAFMAALLTSDFQNLDRISIEISECDRMGIKVLQPDVNESYVEFGVIKQEDGTENIRFAMSAIKNVGLGVAEKIVAERDANGPYKSLEDFICRLGTEVLNKKAMEALAKAGALDCLGERNQLLAGMETIIKYASTLSKQLNNNQLDLFGMSDDKGTAAEQVIIPLPDVPKAEDKQMLAWEKELLGIYISGHPLKAVAHLCRTFGKPMSEITTEMDGKKIRVAGILTTVKKIITKSNEPMLFVGIEDTTGLSEILVFPKLYADTHTMWESDKLVVVEGRISTKDGQIKVIANQVWEMTADLALDSYKAMEDLNLLEREGKRSNNYRGNKGGGSWNKGGAQSPDGPAARSYANKVFSGGNGGGGGESGTPRKKSAEPEFEKALYITLPPNSPKEILEHLKGIITERPGDTKVILRLPSAAGYREVEAKTRVSVSESLLQSLESTVGTGNSLVA
jgi:DNA polymerase-3 subunit alpha